MKTQLRELGTLEFWIMSVIALVFSVLFFAVGGYCVFFLMPNPWWLKYLYVLIWGVFLYLLFKYVEKGVHQKLKNVFHLKGKKA